MYNKKKEKLYIRELLDDPVITYPAYYILSAAMRKNELLHHALSALHACCFEHYTTPTSYDEIFKNLHLGTFPLYKEQYIVGYFGGKMMYLESNGWHSMPANEDIFKLENWLIS